MNQTFVNPRSCVPCQLLERQDRNLLRLIVLACPAVLRYTNPSSPRDTPSDTGTPRQKFPWQKTTRQLLEKPAIPRPTRHYIVPRQLGSNEFLRRPPAATSDQTQHRSVSVRGCERIPIFRQLWNRLHCKSHETTTLGLHRCYSSRIRKLVPRSAETFGPPGRTCWRSSCLPSRFIGCECQSVAGTGRGDREKGKGLAADHSG